MALERWASPKHSRRVLPRCLLTLLRHPSQVYKLVRTPAPPLTAYRSHFANLALPYMVSTHAGKIRYVRERTA
jgi:hypothetical protein